MISSSENFFCVLLRRASGRNLLLLSLLYVQFVGVLQPWAEAELKGLADGTGPLDLLFSYTPEEAYSMLKAYGPHGRLFYAAMEVTVNLAHPLVYALLSVGMLLFFYSRIPGIPEWLVKKIILVPVVVMVIDLAENICFLTMLIDYPYPHYGLAVVSSGLTSLKWITAVIMGGMLLLGAVGFTIFTGRGLIRKQIAKLNVPTNRDLP